MFLQHQVSPYAELSQIISQSTAAQDNQLNLVETCDRLVTIHYPQLSMYSTISGGYDFVRSNLHAHLIIGGNDGAVVEVVLLDEEGDEVHVLEDEVGLRPQAQVLGLHTQQLARRLKGAHLKVLARRHLALHDRVSEYL